MWSANTHREVKPVTYQKRQSFFIDKDFQVKYTLVVVMAAVIGILVSAVPIYYFLDQNYEIFRNLAYSDAPELLNHLEREHRWMKVLLTGSIVGVVVFFTFLGLRMTAKIVAPIKLISNHMKKMTRGLWKQKELKIRDDDEFQDLVDTYNYFYQSFQVYLEEDVRKLEAMEISSEDSQTYNLWKSMIEDKRLQLKRKPLHVVQDPISSDELLGEGLSPRRAS